MKSRIRLGAIAALAAVPLVATACSGPAGTAEDTGSSTESTAFSGASLAVGYEGGVAVLDAETLEMIDSFESEDFIRLNSFGDEQHVLVTTSEGFQVLDAGAEPELTGLVFDAEAAGHVVVHDGKTVLFADGTGTTTIVDTDALADGAQELPDAETYQADAAHHGVSIVLADGTLLTTVGDDSGRTGAVALEPHDDHWHDLATNDECPGIHGEGTAADEAVIFGCENGALLFHDGEFTKFEAPDVYGRMGNAFVSETSPIIVGDYKDDPDAEGYLLHAVTLIDTDAMTYEVVELPEGVEYTFRDVARGPDDLAYIIATDGSLHVLDPESGEIVDEHPVIGAWEGPAQWQDPHPSLKIAGDIAYVTEPAQNAVHAVDLASGEIVASVTLDVTPNEIAHS